MHGCGGPRLRLLCISIRPATRVPLATAVLTMRDSGHGLPGRYATDPLALQLASHYHPSVARFASTLLCAQHIEYASDPLQDFTLMRFLDKFVFRCVIFGRLWGCPAAGHGTFSVYRVRGTRKAGRLPGVAGQWRHDCVIAGIPSGRPRCAGRRTCSGTCRSSTPRPSTARSSSSAQRYMR
jgi:hypothetical protein